MVKWSTIGYGKTDSGKICWFGKNRFISYANGKDVVKEVNAYDWFAVHKLLWCTRYCINPSFECIED